MNNRLYQDRIMPSQSRQDHAVTEFGCNKASAVSVFYSASTSIRPVIPAAISTPTNLGVKDAPGTSPVDHSMPAVLIKNCNSNRNYTDTCWEYPHTSSYHSVGDGYHTVEAEKAAHARRSFQPDSDCKLDLRYQEGARGIFTSAQTKNCAEKQWLQASASATR